MCRLNLSSHPSTITRKVQEVGFVKHDVDCWIDAFVVDEIITSGASDPGVRILNIRQLLPGH